MASNFALLSGTSGIPIVVSYTERFPIQAPSEEFADIRRYAYCTVMQSRPIEITSSAFLFTEPWICFASRSEMLRSSRLLDANFQ